MNFWMKNPIVAQEEDEEESNRLVAQLSGDGAVQNQREPQQQQDEEDVIPGPPREAQGNLWRALMKPQAKDSVDVSSTEHHIRGGGILASKTDLRMPAEEFATGCNLLQVAARGDLSAMKKMLKDKPRQINFRDYDRRTALHVAASEGHLDIVKWLVDAGASINRSDRWGGSPLDDAHRHQHQDVIRYLRSEGATTGSLNKLGNFITAAADGDLDEILMLLQSSSKIINEGDYDQRTALHLAAGEGHVGIVRALCEAGANVNAEDRWGGRPLNDAERQGNQQCVDILKEYGAVSGSLPVRQTPSQAQDESYLKVEFEELDIIERIGAGAFGEIYRCRWRGTLVAAKVIKTAKIRKEWLKQHALLKLRSDGSAADDAIRILDEAESASGSHKEDSAALEDFRKEIGVLKSLR